MRSKTAIGIMLALLTTGILAFTSEVQLKTSESTVIIVPDHYPSIQEAVYAANPRDRIMVRNGTHHEWINVNQTVSLFAEYEHGAIVDGLNAGTIFTVTANNVNISDFKIRNAGTTGSKYGVKLSNVTGCYIQNNIASNNVDGIYVDSSSDGNVISGNEIIGNSYAGIYLYSTTNNTIIGNIICDNNHGLVLSKSSYNNVTKNSISTNTRYGVFFDSSNPTSNYNTISSNNISNNVQRGICLIGYSPSIRHTNNRFYHNNIILNNPQFYLYYVGTNEWDDGFPSGGNYWSDYEARYPDAEERDNTGIWDTPYVLDTNNFDRFPLMEPYPFFKDTSPPEIFSVDWTPTCPPPFVSSSIPREGEPAYVEANISDPSGVAKVLLSYRIDQGDWWNILMAPNVTTDLWTMTIPGQLGNATVEFFIEAFDEVGNANTSSTYAYTVEILLSGDINGDGKVDAEDLYIVATNYGKT